METLLPLSLTYGESEELVLTVTRWDGTDLTIAAATLSLQDAAGEIVLPPMPMDPLLAGNTVRFSFLISSGFGMLLGLPGVYHGEIDLALGEAHTWFFFDIPVSERPEKTLARVTKSAGLGQR